MPSEGRLVQLYMSKTLPVTTVLPEEWVPVAKLHYQRWLRRALQALKIGTGESPKVVKRAKGGAFRATSEVVCAEVDADPLRVEVDAWASLAQERIKPFISKSGASAGILNEFALLQAMKDEFPLHHFVFKQVSSHMPHEGNSEETFSLSGSLSSDNTHTDPTFLSELVSINKNRARCDPEAEAVLASYYTTYGKPPEEEVIGYETETGEDDEEEDEEEEEEEVAGED